jgi:hypothetical protein
MSNLFDNANGVFVFWRETKQSKQKTKRQKILYLLGRKNIVRNMTYSCMDDLQ